MKLLEFANSMIFGVVVLLLLSSNSVAWFGEGYLFSNLQWTPNGDALVWESGFESGIDEGVCRDSTPKILILNLASGEIRNLTPDVTSIDVLSGVTILLSGLYGVSHLVDDDEIEPLIFKPTFHNTKNPKVLYVDWDEGFMIYGLLALQIGEVYRRELSSGDEEMLVDRVNLANYLKGSNCIIYTSEVVIGNEEQVHSGDEKLIMYDLETGESRIIFSEHKIWSMGIALDESRVFLLTEEESKKEKGVFPKPKPKKKIQSISLADDKCASETLFEGFIDSINKDKPFLSSPDGENILFFWYEDFNGDAVIMSSKDLLHISTIDVYNGGITNLPYDEINNPLWSPDGNSIAFWRWDEESGDYCVCVYDGENGIELIRKNVGLEWSYENDNLMGLMKFTWLAHGNYLAYTTGLEGIGADGLEYTSNPTLNVINVGEDSHQSFEDIGGYNFIWRSYSLLLYSNGSHLFNYDVPSGAEGIFSTGNGCDFYFDDVGGLVYRVEYLPEGYSEYWRLDMIKGFINPYPDGAVPESEEMAEKEDILSVPSPDGDKVAVWEGGKLTIYDREGANPILLMEEGAIAPVWSPQGDRLAWIREGMINDVYPYTDIWIANSDGSGVMMIVEKMTNY